MAHKTLDDRKQAWKPGNMLYPVPVVMVSCGGGGARDNIVTVAWAGTICTEPPMLSVSLRPERHSAELIKASGGLVVNLVTKRLVAAADWCGVKSGRDYDKFKECHLTAQRSADARPPLIVESPVNIECTVKDILPLGSHELYLAEVVNIQIAERYLDDKGRFRLDKTDPICYCHGFYYNLGQNLGRFGFSVRKK